MNFGQNALDFVVQNAQPLVLIGIVIGGVVLALKRKFTMLAGYVGISIIAVGIVFNYNAVKDLLLGLFNQILNLG